MISQPPISYTVIFSFIVVNLKETANPTTRRSIASNS